MNSTERMECEAVRDALDDYVDGQFDGETAAAVADHLGSCLGCRRELVNLQDLVRNAAALPSHIEPEGDLWPSIESRLGGSRRRSLPGRVWMAAAAALILVLLLPLLRRAPEPPVETPAHGYGYLAELARSEDGALLPHSDLLATLGRERDDLSPETLAIVEENMRIIDDAIGEIRAVLDAEPQDPRLNLLLADRYQQEVNLLKRLNQI